MDVFSLLISMLILALIVGGLFWLIGQLPAQMQVPARMVLVVLCIIVLLGWLFGAVSIPIHIR